MRLSIALFALALSFGPVLAQQQVGDDSLGAIQPEIAHAAATDGSLAKVMDAFIRAYAADVPSWRTDIRLGGATADSVPPDGFQKGRSEMSGYYYFRPKTSDMLSLESRRAILRDKRFPQFLAQMRLVADEKAAPLDPALVSAAKAPKTPAKPAEIGRAELMSKLLAGRRAPPDTIYFDISPDELVLPGRIVITSNAVQTP